MPANVESYEYRGESYRTEEEAKAAKKQYRKLKYLDAASVGFDRNRYDQLLASGQGLSQMSRQERDYIKSQYAKSTDPEKYTNSTMDQLLMSIGLPPSRAIGNYRTSYAKYASSGSLEDNYGNLSDDQWKKINELWAKDWEYGLSDADVARKALGLAPVAYDALYEDTLLDQELKEKGLPPSKLLNGKLGETYNTWQKNTRDYNQLLDAATRRYIAETSKSEIKPGVYDADDLADWTKGISNEAPKEYTMEDALRDTMNSPEWLEFASKHYGMPMNVPNPDDEEFIVKEDGLPKLDENGEYVYDQEKYQKAWDKAVKNNLGIDSDEFAITPEKFQEYYNANAAFTKADMLAAEWFGDNGVDFDYATRMLNPDYLAKIGDFYIGQTVNEGEGYTLEMLYPGIEFTDEEKAYYQPLIDKANQLREKEGYAASEEYLLGGEFAAAARKVGNDRIVAEMRKRYADVPDYDKKTDAEILHSYYEGVGKSYLMTDEEIAKMENGEMSLQQYMATKCATPMDAAAFADKQYERFLTDNHLPTTDAEWKDAIKSSQAADEYVQNLLRTNGADTSYTLAVSKSENEWKDLLNYWSPIYHQYKNYTEALNAGMANEWQDAKDSYELANAALRMYGNIRSISGKWYDPSVSWQNRTMYTVEGQNEAYTKKIAYKADALSYTEDFAKKTADKEYVNQRFEQIVDKWGDSLTHKMDDEIAAYATDEDKAKIVYMYDHTDKNTPEGERITYVDASIYLNKYMMRQWDAERRIDQAEEAGYFGSESDSAFVRWIGGLGTVLASTLASIPQGVANLLVDSATLLSGHEIYSSNRGNWTTDWMGSLSQHLVDKDGNEIGAFAINLIPSMVQSAASMALAVATDGASEAVTLALMAAQSYSGAVDTALQNGATSEQAFAYGLLSGANEMIFEKLSLDTFIKNIDVTKAAFDAAKASGKYSAKQLTGLLAGKILQHAGTQGFIEGSEEFFTSVANLLAENWILADKTAFNKTVQHYMEGGMSREEAEKLANEEIFKDVCVDFIGGFVSGALMAFGGDMIKTGGGRVYVDRTGVTRFVTATHNLSLISFNDALSYANANLQVNSDGKFSAESAQKVFDALRKKGADAATLSRVMNSYSDNATPDAMTAMRTAITEQKNEDGKKLVKAANKYVYNRQAKGKSDVTKGQIEFATKEWLDNYSGAVQQSDIRELEASAQAMRNGYITEIAELASNGKGNASAGMTIISQYMASLPADVQAKITENAAKYKRTFNKAFGKGAQAANYANIAATLEYAAGDGNALQGMNAIFGDGAALAPQAIRNAILSDDGAHASKFVDMVAQGVALLSDQGNTHLFSAAQNGVNPTAYVASQFALAQSMPEYSLSRSMYDYIEKYGATNEAMDLLTAATIHESNAPFARQIRITTGTFYTTEQLAQITNDYEKALTDYNEKLKIKGAHEQANAQERTEHEARIANYAQQVATLEKNVKEDTSLAKTYADRVSELQNAQSALETLLGKQNQRMTQTNADVNEAERKYKAAKTKYWNAMQDQAAQYIQRFGSSLEAIKGRQRISHAELMRMSALAQYGTAENLNDINEKIIASEKAAAVALGRALGVDVQCVEFGNAFFDEKKIAQSNRNETSPGVVIGGTVYLNTKVMEARVGSLTDHVLMHELGHILESSADNYKKYAMFAKDFLIKHDGKGAYDFAKKAFMESGMTEQQAERELVAEFTRQVSLADPRAVAALCKSAPNMSMRVFQWLTNTRNRMSTVASAQSRIIIDAQREFAKGMKAIRNNNAVATQTDDASVSPTRASMENAMKQMNERMRIEAENQRNAQKQTTEQQPSQPARTEQQTTQTETPATTEETQTQPAVEETEQTAETVEEMPEETPTEEQPAEESVEEEPAAEEQPVEEPQEDFADVDIEQENEYNKSKGENSDGADQIKSAENAAESERDVQRLSGSVEPAADRRSESGRADGRANPRLPESVRVTLSNRGITPVDLVSTEDAPNFYERIGEAKKLNPYGAFVTQHEIDEYTGMKLFLDGTGSVGVAVTNDGNIVSVFKNTNGNAPKGSVSSILLTALENGGIKLDNFNSSNLSRMYALHGFIPVSRTKFNDEFAPADWNYERDGRPDIVFWMHNGDSLQTIAENVGKYKVDYDYDSLPMFEDNDEGYGYDRAEAYRDAKLKETLENAANEAGYNVEAYHGTSEGGFDVFDYGHMRYGLFGTGFYFTEDPEIAQTYTKKGKGKNPEVKHVRLDAHNEIDMDAKADVGAWIKSADDADFDLQPFIDEIAAEKGGVENLTNTDCFHALKNAIAYDGDVPDYEAGEITSGVIQSMGYDGITHIGGNRRGNGEHPHRVHIVFEQEQIKSADPVTYDKETGNAIPRSERFNRNKGSISYYTEYDPQALAVKRSIDGLSERENKMSGQPRMIQTDNGYVVARKVSREGFMTGNPMFNTNRQNIALIAPVSEFNGDVKRPVGPSRCTAVVVPNTDAYAGTRADARDAGANVYAYDESDPSQFDRAIDRAANMSSVAYFPSMTYDELIARYKAIPQGMKPRVEGRVVPQQTTDTNRVSRAARTAIESPITTDETAEDAKSWIVDDGAGTFEPVSNMKSLNRARSVIERAGSVSQAAEDLHSAVANNDGKATDLLARAELLYAEAQNPNSGLTDIQREHIFADLCMISSDAGRALQLTAQLKRMTPEGHIDYIEQVGKRMADKYEKRTKKPVDLTLTQEEIDAYKGAATEEQRKAIDRQVSERWGQEMKDLPLADRIRNWRYFSMLGNPRTHFRNIVGNALMNPVARAKDFNNTWLQRIFEHAGNEDTRLTEADRTTTYWTKHVDSTTKNFVDEQLKRMLPVMQSGSSKYMEEIAKSVPVEDDEIEGSWLKRTKKTLTQPVNSARLSNADNKWGNFWNKLSYINSNALELEDAKALSRRFRSAMYQIIQARGIDVTEISNAELNAITNYAAEEALRATFRDASALADALNRFANTNRLTQFAMEAIVPFKKTPINIAKRSFEYSPIGLVNGFYKLASNSKQYKAEIASINANTKLTDAQKAARIEQATSKEKAQKIVAIDRLASGVTGTMLSAIGYFMASMGWVSIGRKDDDKASFEQGLGKNTYSLNIGDLSIDLSAFSPAAVPLLMGTALYESGNVERDSHLVSTVLDVLAESVDPITEMSMISGIADALSGIGSQREDGANTRWAMQIAGNAAESYIGQFIPTAAGQIARMLDPYSRSYTAGDDYWATKAFGSEIGTSVKKLQNKIPFVAWLSEPKVNIHGEEQRNYTNFGAGLAHILNNTIAPATIKVDQKNEIDDELIRLYGVVDSADLFPTKPSRNLGSYDNTPIKITSDSEYMQYQREFGQTVYDMLEDLMMSANYQRMTDTQKADAVERIIDQAKSATKKRWKAQKVAGMK